MPTPTSQLPFSSRWISQTLDLTQSATEQTFSAFSTDSRKVSPTEFFVAIKGDKFDGHEFLQAAVDGGVKGILCEKGRAPKLPGIFIAEVPDVLAAFRKLAQAWRLKFSVPVVAVAGAVGKTTTKELLASCLRGKWPLVLSTEGSLNGFVGIPISLLNLREGHQAAVIEIGIDDIGTMAQHLEIVRPETIVVTAIAEEHLENLKDLATVAREELIGMTWVDSNGGRTIFNLDDPWIAQFYATQKWKHARTISLTGKKPPSASWLAGEWDGTRLKLYTSQGGPFALTPPLPGKHNAQNLALSAAVAQSLGLTPEEIRAGLATFRGPKGRSEVHKLPNDLLVLADYYNASPASMRASLQLFEELGVKRNGGRWLFLGDMLELGEHELELHAGLCHDIAKVKPTQVVLFGPRMKSLAQKLEQETKIPTRHFENMETLIAETVPQIAAGDLVAIKGSRGMRMERLWEALKQSVVK